MSVQSVQSVAVDTSISIDIRYLRIKRIIDLAFTLLILLPLCIVIGIVAMLIKLDSKGPVFFRQRRVGRDGVEFNMLKFRSMYAHVDDNLHRQAIERYMSNQKLADNDGNSNNLYKLNHDPRITGVGRFLRKTSIDELPQFFNVMRGQMTLVGPRPPMPYEVTQYSQHDWLRLTSKPGLTGTWQVYGRSCVTFERMVEMDIEYLQHQSVWEDLKLVALTVPVMITGRGGA